MTADAQSSQEPVASGGRASFRWLRALAPVPAALLALLPSFTCPVCIAAYAGVLSAAGLGFMYESSYQTPLIVGFLLVGIASVAYTSRSHRKPAPLLLTLLGGAAVVAGKVVWEIPYLMYAGAALLFGATVYNLWLKRPKRRAVAPGQPALEVGGPAASVAIRIEGLACGGCVGQLKSTVRAIPGVRSIELDGERASIDYFPSATNPEALRRAIDELGYRAIECM